MTRINSLYGSLTSPVVLCMQNSGISTRITSLHRSRNYKSVWLPALICSFCMQNSDFKTRITSLYGSQTSPVVLCVQNSMISIRITNLYRSQPSSVVFACKAATFVSELQVSKGPRLRLLICECKTACLDPE